MASLLSPTRSEERAPLPAGPESVPAREESVLVAGIDTPVAADYAAYLRREPGSESKSATDNKCEYVDLFDPESTGRLPALAASARVTNLVLFLGPKLRESDKSALEVLVRLSTERRLQFVGVVSTFRVHLGDRNAAEMEAEVVGLFKGVAERVVVFRPGFVLSANCGASTRLRRFGSLFPLVPGRLRSCFVSGDELFSAIEHERCSTQPRSIKFLSLLGPNRPWRELLAQHRPGGFASACLTVLSFVLSLLLLGHLTAFVLGLLARRRP